MPINKGADSYKLKLLRKGIGAVTVTMYSSWPIYESH